MHDKKPALLRLFLVFITIFVSANFFFKYGKDAYSYYGDSLGYYLYLPSAFIYHNFDSIEKLPHDKEIPASVIRYTEEFETQSRKSPKGYYLNQYTYGVAFFQLPFFMLAHLYEKVFDLPCNGYSENYHSMIKLSSLIFALLGFFFLYKSLRKWFNETISIFTICCILLGTNMFWFTLHQAGMSHIPLFFLYSLLLYATIKFHEQPKWKYAILIGLSAGFITVIRPSDIVCLLIPILYNMYSLETFKSKLAWLIAEWKLILLSGIVFILPIIPQLIFWKIYSGQFVYNSYLDQSFDFKHPHIIEGLFSFSNGWLAYSPLMILSLLGFFWIKNIKQYKWVLLILLPIYMYIIYSWWCYNYINGLGSRPMIHMYPLLAFPLATIISFLYQRGKIVQFISSVFIILFCAINYSYSCQQARGELYAEHSTMQFALNTMFKSGLTYKDLVMADINIYQPDENEMNVNKLLGVSTLTDSNQHEFYTAPEGEEYPKIEVRIPISTSNLKGSTHFKCSGLFYMNEGPYDIYHDQMLVLDLNRGDKNIFWEGIRIGNKIGKAISPLPKTKEMKLGNSYSKEWGRVYFFIPIPKNIHDNDQLKLGIWNLSKKLLLVKDLKIESCRMK